MDCIRIRGGGRDATIQTTANGCCAALDRSSNSFPGVALTMINPRAGKPADESMLTNIPRLVTAYYALHPDPAVPAQRVAFGTSGHRGSSAASAFNEDHIVAITQAICLY